jgi:hypothetical protein
MRKPFIWMAVVLLVVGAAALVADVGTSVLWFAFITIGLAMVAIEQVVGNE